MRSRRGAHAARAAGALVLAMLAPPAGARAEPPPVSISASHSFPRDREGRRIHLTALGAGHLVEALGWLDWTNEARLFHARGTVVFADEGTRETRTTGIAGITSLRPRLALGSRSYATAVAGFGVTLSLDPFPVRGTRYNFQAEIGVGAGVRVAPRWYLEVGVRLSHLSNAKGFDETKNPSYDGIVGR